MRQIEKRELGVGLLGVGHIGGAVANKFVERLQSHGITLHTVLVKDPSKDRPGLQLPDGARLTDDPHDIFLNPKIDIVVELTGTQNLEEARGFINDALRADKHVVTAHKPVLAEYLPDFHDLANSRGLSLSYEASVCGTIPIISLFGDYYRVQTINRLDGIINGTTNYILGRMGEGVEFKPALQEAQVKEIAEPDPTADIKGHDPQAKLSVLATLASKQHIPPSAISCEGITEVTPEGIAAAREQGGVIKLLASAKQEQGVWLARVRPEFVSQDNPLASVTGTFNSITIESDLSGAITYTGPGAGPYPTAAAVFADILHAAEHIRYGTPDYLPQLQRAAVIASAH